MTYDRNKSRKSIGKELLDSASQLVGKASSGNIATSIWSLPSPWGFFQAALRQKARQLMDSRSGWGDSRGCLTSHCEEVEIAARREREGFNQVRYSGKFIFKSLYLTFSLRRYSLMILTLSLRGNLLMKIFAGRRYIMLLKLGVVYGYVDMVSIFGLKYSFPPTWKSLWL